MLQPHPEARFQTPADLRAHCEQVYRQAYPYRRHWPVIPATRCAPLDTVAPTQVATAPARACQAPDDAMARYIVAGIAELHGLTAEDVFGGKQTRDVVAARWNAIVAIAEARPGWSLPRLGAFFNRDHTTILYVLRKRGVERSALRDGARAA